TSATTTSELSLPTPDPPEQSSSRRARKPRPIIFITILLIIALIAVAAGVVLILPKPANQQSTSTAKPSQQWVTIQTLSGNGLKKSPIFTVSNNWRIAWSCDIASHNNKDYSLFIHALTTTNTLLNNSVETTCSKNNTHGFTQVNQGGKIYLSI